MKSFSDLVSNRDAPKEVTKGRFEIAKNYTVTGRKEDDLVNTFKSLKAAGGTAFNEKI